MFFTAFVLCILRLPNNIQKTSLQCYKTQIKIFAYPGSAYSGFEQPGPRVPLLGLAKSIYCTSRIVLRPYAPTWRQGTSEVK